MNIVLQPVANTIAQQHLVKTIYNSIPLDFISQYISPNDLSNLKSIYQDGNVKVWGVKSKNASKHNKLNRGDIVLFCAHRTVSLYGEISYIINSPELAIALWGNDDDGETWENIYFLSNVSNSVDIPTSEVNSSLGYDKNYNIQGFNVVSELSPVFRTHFLGVYPIFRTRRLFAYTPFSGLSKNAYAGDFKPLLL